ncbi:MAG: recombinase family protein [Planctomycetota bacterium]
MRDKTAATKKQGYWVCGQPPLGYRLQRGGEPRGLYIVPDEAGFIRVVFDRFLEAQSLFRVAEELNFEGHTTKRWTSSAGRVHGGKPLTRKYIHGLLTNPVYIGMIRHRRGETQEVCRGRREPIATKAVWDRVQASIRSPDRDRIHRLVHLRLLKGKLRTHDGYAISPTSAHRPAAHTDSTSRRRGRRLNENESLALNSIDFLPAPAMSGVMLLGARRRRP